jgi:hypothetical protein
MTITLDANQLYQFYPPLDIMTEDAAADLLGFHVRTLQKDRKRERPRIPFVRGVNGRIGYDQGLLLLMLCDENIGFFYDIKKASAAQHKAKKPKIADNVVSFKDDIR